MSYTSLQLITGSYHLAGIVSRDFETVTGQQSSDGLIFLNDIIADKTVDTGLIPYYTEYDFNGVIGQEKYTIANLISIDTFTFYIDTVRYSTQPQKLRRYFGSSRAEGIQSLPGVWHMERELGGASLYIYFVPDQTYPMTIWGQFRLSAVTLAQDLELTLDRYYINYLKFELANRLCAEYNYNVPPMVTEELRKYRHMISKKTAPLDLNLTKLSSLQKRGGINYAQVNIGKGWIS